jgi:hypothetical protein
MEAASLAVGSQLCVRVQVTTPYGWSSNDDPEGLRGCSPYAYGLAFEIQVPGLLKFLFEIEEAFYMYGEAWRRLAETGAVDLTIRGRRCSVSIESAFAVFRSAADSRAGLARFECRTPWSAVAGPLKAALDRVWPHLGNMALTPVAVDEAAAKVFSVGHYFQYELITNLGGAREAYGALEHVRGVQKRARKYDKTISPEKYWSAVGTALWNKVLTDEQKDEIHSRYYFWKKKRDRSAKCHRALKG